MFANFQEFHFNRKTVLSFSPSMIPATLLFHFNKLQLFTTVYQFKIQNQNSFALENSVVDSQLTQTKNEH